MKISSYRYEIELDLTHPAYFKDLVIVVDGVLTKINNPNIQFDSQEKMTLQEVNNKFLGTKAFKIIKGTFKDDK